jgi:RNA polymerase sigma factor (sigma-70 family)
LWHFHKGYVKQDFDTQWWQDSWAPEVREKPGEARSMIDILASEQLAEIWRHPVDGSLFWLRLFDVVKPHWHQILKRKNVPNHDIDDVVGNMWLKLLEYLPKKKEVIEDPKAWLSKVALNAAMQYHREESRRTSRLVQMNERMENNLPAEQTDQEVERRRAATTNAFDAMLKDKSIKEIAKTIFNEYCKGKTDAEISGALGIGMRSVSRHKAIVKNYLYVKFSQFYNRI